MTKRESDLFDQMLEEQAKALAKEKNEGAEESTAKRSVRDTLANFREYITSFRFKMKCYNESKKYGCDYKVVRNAYVSNILGKIADILNLTISITSEAILYAVDFIGRLIDGVVNLAVTVCKKIIQLFTLNCGSVSC
jgi:hypothetical protein